MQRASTTTTNANAWRATSNHSSSGPRRDAGSFSSKALHSPSDSPPTPVGIEFTRGSFSAHLASIEPAPSPLPLPLPRAARATPTTSLLRSPTRKRPPPPPSAAPPRPLISGKNKPTATSSTILVPPQRQPSSSRQAASGVPSAVVSPSPPLRPMSLMDVSVDPVDTLAKKLRQQAAELTKLYEQMEQKDDDLDHLRRDVKQLHLQIDVQRSKQRLHTQPVYSRGSTVAKTTAAPVSTRRGIAMGSAPSTSKKKNLECAKEGGQGASTQKETPHEETTVVTMKRMEEALTELRQCHQELPGRCEPPAGASVSSDEIQNEQNLYIRVLEEAVHLKASELCITGHEELLVVLAELRHTIYQQEQEIEELHQVVAATKSDHLQCKTATLEADDLLQTERTKWQQDVQTMQHHETTLQRQLDETQRLVHAEHMRFKQERAAHHEQASRVETLDRELRSRTQELHQWETTRSESWRKREATLEQTIQEMKSSLETERTAALTCKQALEKAQRQVEELSVLQDGLLQSIDTFVVKEDAYERKIAELHGHEEARQALQRENETLRVHTEELQQKLVQLTEKSMENQQIMKQWEELKDSTLRLEQAMEAAGSATAQAEETEEAARGTDASLILTDVERIEKWTATIQKTFTSSSLLLPWLLPFLHELSSCLSCVRGRLIQFENESGQWKQSKQQLEQSTEETVDESRRVDTLYQEVLAKLRAAEQREEDQKLLVVAMEEEIKEARAQDQLRDALAEQIYELEQLLKTLQKRLDDAVDQNQELVALETSLTKKVHEKDHRIMQITRQVSDLRGQEALVHELEQELQEAASLAEQQNAWNQRLTVELEHLELEKADQDQLFETLTTTQKAFSTRFEALFRQYLAFVMAAKQQFVDELAGGSVKDNGRPLATYEEAASSGHILEMLRVFPTLMEEYLAGAILNGHGNVRADEAKTSKKAKAVRSPKLADRQQEWQDPMELDKQLQEISFAFSKFKS